MLAGPAMIGKTTAAECCRDHDNDVVVLKNDVLMHDMFKRYGLRGYKSIDISDTANWLRLLKQTRKWNESDIGRLHADWLSACPSPVIVAEGYLYMLSWYRSCVYQGLAARELDHWLVKFEPPMVEQVARRKGKWKSFYGWLPKADSDHEAALVKQWSLFEMPSSAKCTVRFETVESCAELLTLLTID